MLKDREKEAFHRAVSRLPRLKKRVRKGKVKVWRHSAKHGANAAEALRRYQQAIMRLAGYTSMGDGVWVPTEKIEEERSAHG